MDLDSTLCYCFHIPKRKIVNFVKQTRPKRASLISDCFGAGTGCGWCIPFLKRIHRQVMEGRIVEAGDLSASDYEAMRRRYRDGVRDGAWKRHSHDMDEAAWDVSLYFSRPPSSDPEPETLGGPG